MNNTTNKPANASLTAYRLAQLQRAFQATLEAAGHLDPRSFPEGALDPFLTALDGLTGHLAAVAAAAPAKKAHTKVATVAAPAEAASCG